MVEKKEKKNYLIDGIITLIAFFIVLSSNTVYYTSNQHNYYISELLVCSLSMLVIALIAFRKINKNKIGSFMVFYIVYLCVAIIWLLINSSTKIDNFIAIFFVLFGITLFVHKTSEYDLINVFLKKYVNIMCVLAIISLFFYFLGPVLNIVKPTGIEDVNWGGIKSNYSYYNMFFTRQREVFLGNRIFRNTGIFTEGPMYSLSLTISLAIEVFLIKNEKKSKKIILLFTIITTISTTGIIISCLIIFLDYINKKNKTTIIRYIKILFLPILILILVIISIYFYNQKADTSSYNTRIDDYIASYSAWKQKPIFGNGYGSSDEIKKYMSSFRDGNKGLSNSIMVVLAQGGIIMLFFYFYTIVKVLRYKKDKYIVEFLIIMVLLFVTTIFLYMPMLIYFLAIAYSLPLKSKILNKEAKNDIL